MSGTSVEVVEFIFSFRFLEIWDKQILFPNSLEEEKKNEIRDEYIEES